MLFEFWHNFTHNLFKPLLLFFYMGFLIPILKVQFEFPYVLYQGLTLYLLLAIGWRGGQELATIDGSSIGNVLGFIVLGFVTNLIIGFVAYGMLTRMTRMRRVDRATVAGYYGSDSAGTFATCLGVLAALDIAFDAYMPVMLAIMEIPGCIVALLLVARLRERGMDALGNMPDEPGYDPKARLELVTAAQLSAQQPVTARQLEAQEELEVSLEKRAHPDPAGAGPAPMAAAPVSAPLLREVLLNPGLYLLFGGIIIGFVGRLQGPAVIAEGDPVFVTAFQGILGLFLLEMGMTASRKLKDLQAAGRGLIVFGLLAPNLFAIAGILIIHGYAQATATHFEIGSYVLFAVLCGAASYIAVPAVQRIAIPEASPTVPLAASLGLTFSYNVTIGIPLYLQIAQAVNNWLPLG
ncbi:sodium-dependent bicarbonate transport family permease [Mycolicibacter senuensis]|uniref:Sodium-dependent bicarbonate transport family permease n=1 Tax=Mycolicibacter senuensis TaxID=386913 RepID=A0A7I9XP91_9MYCO|nr:sodium-dependent bicarbonate transport family permease [Mycolicibacter senuensis]MDQ2627895.1 sodium-dependent bicarbonate transport family permease [Actinomycetota bacterium]ORW69751.1 sodium-dependent bicarbonate transport family permease [Mycolicibacter senuensis]GFG71771.1 sodium-dependent bicarbonate transport family permease [Mycolicibacter senuensis]